MTLLPYALARPFLFGLDPEAAHDLTMASLARLQGTPARLAWAQKRVDDPLQLAGLHFPNRIGLAAGLDKNARCIDGLAAMGFGFIEVGTVTPLAQPGNPKPRMFRLPAQQALINRLGFNNEGLQAFIENVKRSQNYSCLRRFDGSEPQKHAQKTNRTLIGLNIGKNAATPIERALDDYLACLDGVYPYADYVTVNISSPNTKNLRELQSDEALDALVGALVARRAELATEHGALKPLFIKIAPDLEPAQLLTIAATLRRYGFEGDRPTGLLGVIATNTTISRETVAGHEHADEVGGLSGRPVFEKSNAVIAALRQLLGPGFPIVGVGGVMSGADAVAKLHAGADVVQIYTGLIYKGPALVREAALAVRSAARSSSAGQFA